MKRKVLVLGGGLLQLPLVKMAIQRGFEVYLSDYYKNPPAKKYCDGFRQISSFSIDDNYEYALAEKISHIMTIGTDQPVYTAACVSAKLNLPHPISPGQGKMVTNKHCMKTKMAEEGIPTPEFRVYSRYEEVYLDNLNYPLVMKPVDSQGQRGIFILNGAEEPGEIENLFTATVQYSRTNSVIFEEFYPGTEITANCWVKGGKVFILMIADRLHFDDKVALGICKQHRFPSKAAGAYQEDIDIVVQKLAESFKIKDGPLYIQMIIGSQGVKVIEFGYRIGGGFEAETIPLVTGIDILDLYFTLVIEGVNKFQPGQVKEKAKLGSTFFLFAHPGVAAKFKMPVDFKKHCGKLFIEDNAKIGEIKDATARLGCFAICTDDLDEYNHMLNRFNAEMAIYSPENRDLLLHNIWE